MNQYEKYKPSGIDWIGEIPIDWELTKLRYLSDIDTGGKNTEDRIEDGMYPFFVRSQTVERINSFSFDGEAILTAGDGVGVAKVFHHYNGKFDFHQRVYKMSHFKNVVGKYLFYYLQANLYKEVLKWNAKSTVDSLRLPMFQSFLIAYPKTFEEQTTIANFLDEKTSQIDKLISNKQKLIELLKEERAAIINEAVGGKAKNWEGKKLKYVVTKVGSGVTPKGGASVYLREGIPLLRSQNIYSDGLRLDDVAYINEEIDEQMSNTRIQDGDVLLNVTGASIGRCFYVPKNFGRGNVNQHVCIIRPIKAKIKTEYLHSFLISGIGQDLIDTCQNGANREGLNFQQIKSFEIPLPDISEQENILNRIQSETQRIDSTISKIEKEIELMNEYRTALISEVVTGKIKVI